MSKKVMLIILAAALVLCLACTLTAAFKIFSPLTRFQVERLARADLMSKARACEVEIREVSAGGFREDGGSPAERAEGLRAHASIMLQYAYWCQGSTSWVDGHSYYRFESRGGQWKLLDTIPNSHPPYTGNCPCRESEGIPFGSG